MVATMSEIPVRFRGTGAGTAELTWAQLRTWLMSCQTGRTTNLVTVVPLPGDTTMDDIVAVLRFVVADHPALRTRLRFANGPSGPRHPWQVVAESGEVLLQVADIGDDDDPDAAAEEMRSRYELTWFDYEFEFPVRMGVVRQSGTVRAIVLGCSHVLVDATGLEVLAANVARFLATGAGPEAGLHPLALAADQYGPTGQRQTAKSLRYWETQLDRLGPWVNGTPVEPRKPRFWELAVYSPALELGLRLVEARTKTPSTYVLLAAYAVAVARVMGRNPCVAKTVVDNRFRPGFADAVLQVAQDGICVVDAAAATFDEVVSRAMAAATTASSFAYYDPLACDKLLDTMAARREGPLDIAWFINDRRAPSASDVPTGPEAEAALRDALPRTKMFWDRAQPTFDGSLFMQVDSRPMIASRESLIEDVPAAFLEVWTDTHHFALDQIEALIREMEAIVVAAAFDPEVPTGVR